VDGTGREGRTPTTIPASSNPFEQDYFLINRIHILLNRFASLFLVSRSVVSRYSVVQILLVGVFDEFSEH
jgi:hypothetical protein